MRNLEISRKIEEKIKQDTLNYIQEQVIIILKYNNKYSKKEINDCHYLEYKNEIIEVLEDMGYEFAPDLTDEEIRMKRLGFENEINKHKEGDLFLMSFIVVGLIFAVIGFINIVKWLIN